MPTPRVIVLLVACLLVAGCGSSQAPAGSAPVDPPAGSTDGLPIASGPEAEQLARQACAGAVFANCVDDVLIAMVETPGALIAVCSHPGGTGDIQVIEIEQEAEDSCSANGLIEGSRVVSVTQLP